MPQSLDVSLFLIFEVKLLQKCKENIEKIAQTFAQNIVFMTKIC